MIKKYRALILATILLGTIPILGSGPYAFELFPRPKGQYTVQRGDTLYGIAGLYYENPALWPFLWNQNPSVKMKPGAANPQYETLAPGTKLNLYHQRFAFNYMSRAYEAPTGIPDEARFLTQKIPYRGIPYDKKFFRFRLGQRPARVWGYIVTAPDTTREHYLERDLVYIRFRPSKRQCILVGDRFGVYRERGPLHHPLNIGRPVGFFGEIVGEVEITNVGHDLVTAIVLESFVELKIRDKICLFTPRREEIVPTKTHRMLTGTILRSASRDAYFIETHHLENDVVFIDRGECDGIKQGMLFNIYRPVHPIQDPYLWRRIPVPDRFVGEGMILKAFKKKSTVLITRSREEVLPGDIIKSVSD
jgi:hypothetical protein